MEIYRVTTTASRNKGQIRFGTRFRAQRIWNANKDQPDNKVTVEVMTGDFRDVTADWEAGNYGETGQAAEEHNQDSSDLRAAGVRDVLHDRVHAAESSGRGLGWPS